jgi:hypothetical protein
MSVPYASTIRSTCVFKYEHALCMIGIIGKFKISPEMDHETGRQKVMHLMQDNKVYMLKNKKSGILNIVGYSDNSFCEVCGY